MRRLTVAVLTLFSLLPAHAFQVAVTPTALKVKVRVALFDRDLNLKPVPRLAIHVTPSAQGTAATDITTSLDGIAEVELVPGDYKLSTDKPAELFGKAYKWNLTVHVTKADQVVELSNDNAEVSELTAGRAAHVDELVEQFKRVRDAVVIVWTEDAAGDGLIIDKGGLVLTSQNVVTGHKWLAIQIDNTHRVPAEIVSEDEKRNVAVLRFNPAPLKEVAAAKVSSDITSVVEGERAFAIANPLDSAKAMVSGVISRVEDDRVTTDITPHEVGTPLFDSTGTAIGYSKVVNDKFQFVPMASIRDVIADAQKIASTATALPSKLLPVAPDRKYPEEPLLARHDGRWEKDLYSFKIAGFEVDVQTPVALYQYRQEQYVSLQNEHAKLAAKGKGGEPPRKPEHNAYQATLVIVAVPEYKVSFWKSMGDSMATNGRAPTTVRPKTSFSRMRLLCGAKEVEPILPGRYSLNTRSNAYVSFDRGAYFGRYVFAPESIQANCGEVKLELYSVESPSTPTVKTFDPALVKRIEEDFQPFRQMASSSEGTK